MVVGVQRTLLGYGTGNSSLSAAEQECDGCGGDGGATAVVAVAATAVRWQQQLGDIGEV